MKLPPVVDRIANQTQDHKAPICVLMVGMAGSGKTTLMAQLQQSSVSSATTSSSTVGAPQEERLEGVGGEQNDKDSETSTPSKMPAYCLNLDPATIHVPYNASIDIRDTVDYKVW
jgi:GPN-loop GTPase